MAKKETSKSKEKTPLVGIVGLGYVGLPLAREFCQGGARILGFDVNSQAVAKINKGISPIKHIPHKQMRDMVQSKRFRATEKMSDLSKWR